MWTYVEWCEGRNEGRGEAAGRERASRRACTRHGNEISYGEAGGREWGSLISSLLNATVCDERNNLQRLHRPRHVLEGMSAVYTGSRRHRRRRDCRRARESAGSGKGVETAWPWGTATGAHTQAALTSQHHLHLFTSPRESDHSLSI